MKYRVFLKALSLALIVCPVAWSQEASPTPTPFKERVVDPGAIGGPRPIDQDDAHARDYVKELSWSLSGDPAVAGVEDGVALWNLAQQRNEKLNLQTVLDVSAYGNRTFSGGVQMNEAYTYAFMAKSQPCKGWKEPVGRRRIRVSSKRWLVTREW
ncbi:MAG TPA: hypothetical protein VFO40_24030 [Chthoniobacterales bacterium]|nr:hypothetical protein [Chthoniobacterales bacterium]